MFRKIIFVAFLFSSLVSACGTRTGNAPEITVPPSSSPAAPTSTSLPPTPTETATAAPTETGAPEVKQFKICQLEKFRDYPIAWGDLFGSGGRDSEFLRWLKTQSKPFDPAKLKWVPMQLVDGPGLPFIGYNTKTAPNYRDESTAPFRRNVTCGVTTYNNTDYLVIPIEFADPKDPGNAQKNVWVIGVMLDEIKYRSRDQIVASGWKNQMHIAPIVTSDKQWDDGQPLPLVTKSFDEDPTMPARFQAFLAGNLSALDGKVVQLEIGTNTRHWLE